MAVEAVADEGLLDLSQPWDKDGLVINGKAADARVTRNIAGAKLERSMEASSTLTLDLLDPTWWLLRESKVLATDWRLTTLVTGGMDFTLSELEKTDDGESLVLYDTAIARLQRTTGPLKAARDRMTRAEFAHMLCQRAGVPFQSPDEHDRQPIHKPSPEDRQALRKARKSRLNPVEQQQAQEGGLGALRKARITIKGHRASGQQLRDIATALTVADEQGANTPAREALIFAAIAESSFTRAVSVYNGTTYRGPWQSHTFSEDDIAGAAKAFLTGGSSFGGGGAIALSRTISDPVEIAIKTEVASIWPNNAYAGESGYNSFLPEARKILATWTPGSGGDLAAPRTGTPDRARVERYEFRVGRDEDYWHALQRLADEVGWRCFAVFGVVWFVSDLTLEHATPSMLIQEGRDGIDKIRWTRTARKRIDELTVDCRLTKWAAVPGQCVVVQGEGDDVDGRWLVRRIERDLLDAAGTATVTLGTARRPKPEPAPNVTTIPGTDPVVAGAGSRRPMKAPVGSYPLAVKGSLIGTPGVGTHSFSVPPNNWESDNAVDLGVRKGTEVYAVDDGTIGPQFGLLPGGNNQGIGAFAGIRLHLVTRTNEWYYAHLSRTAPGIGPGRRVKAGALLGYSGVANGVQHLHLACKNGSPINLLGLR